MVFKIIGGLFMVLLGLNTAGIVSIPAMLVGVLGVIAGLALLIGF